MKRIFVLTFAIFLAVSTQAWSQDKKLEAYTGDAAFQKMTNVQKLEAINTAITKKEARSSTFSDYLHRIWAEILAPETSIKSQLEKYGQLKNQYAKLPTNYDYEKYLITMYLAQDPEAKAADLVGKLKLLKSLQDKKLVSWPAAAPFYTALIGYHLAQKADFQTMDAKAKIAYIKSLENQAAGSISFAPFLKGIAINEISSKANDQRKATYDALVGTVGFFTESTMKKAYQDLK